MGTKKKPDGTWEKKISDDQIKEIASRAALGESATKLVAEFGIHLKTFANRRKELGIRANVGRRFSKEARAAIGEAYASGETAAADVAARYACSKGLVTTCARELGYSIDEIVAKRRGEHPGLNQMFAGYLKVAKDRGVPFSLSKEEFAGKASQPCYYCGLPPSNCKRSKKAAKGKENEYLWNYYYSGLDRLDSRLGYTSRNTVSCCMDCNYAKNQKTLQEFYTWLRRAVSFGIFNQIAFMLVRQGAHSDRLPEPTPTHFSGGRRRIEYIERTNADSE